MANGTVQLDELVLRVPGLSRDEARSLGRAVAGQLAEQMPVQVRSRTLGALELRVRIPLGTLPGQLASAVAGRILEAME